MPIVYNFDEMPEADVVVNGVNTRLKKGLNTNIFIIGLSGTGKSSTSLRLGELISQSRKKEPSITVVDNLKELVGTVRKSRVGDVIIIEEVSVLFSSRRAMTGSNVNIGRVLDTCRKKELTIISNAPIWKSIDSHMRSMGHVMIETLRINKSEGVVVSKFFKLQTNPGSGKTYTHTMTRDGAEVARMFTRMPSKERWDEYESKKDKFMDDLYKDLENEELAKERKKARENSKEKWGMNAPTEKQIEIIKSIEEDKLSFQDITIKFNYANKDVARQMYNKAKEKVKNLKIQKEHSSIVSV